MTPPTLMNHDNSVAVEILACLSLNSHIFMLVSPPPFEPTTRAQYCYTLIHNPFTHTEIVINPFLDFCALCYVVLLEARADAPTRGTSQHFSLQFQGFLAEGRSDTLVICKGIGLGVSIREAC